MPCLMTAASRKWVYTMMKVSDYEVLEHSVVASLCVVLGLGYLQSLLIQNPLMVPPELGGLPRIAGSSTFRKATLEANPSLVPLRIVCTSL